MSVAFDLDDIGGENRWLNAEHRALTARLQELNAWAAASDGDGSDAVRLNAVIGREYALLDAAFALNDAAREILDEKIRREGRPA